MTAAAPAAGRQPADRHGGRDLGDAVEARRLQALHHAGAEPLALGQVERDVAAVVHVGPLQATPGNHRLEHMIRDRAGDGRHGRHEHLPMGPCGRAHAPGDGARKRGCIVLHGLSQLDELGHEPLQQALERGGGLGVGQPRLVLRPEGLDDEVDGPVVHVQPTAVGQERDRGAAAHRPPPPFVLPFPAAKSNGQGLSARQPVTRARSPPISARSRMASMWPPRAS